MPDPRPQRIRDPVHNLIEFGRDQFEHTLWRIIQSSPFQRLRRIRQLGFSEFVFPGATHTRFAHSVGVFHNARQLIGVIRKFLDAHNQQFKNHQAEHAIAAALLHDVGHGMFSHAFEEVGKEFNWAMARYEDVSRQLIREGEIAEIFEREFGRGYADNVANIIAQDAPSDLYGSVVSSQFDADRLDYMQRDRLMTGVQSSGVDPTWLLANLEVAKVPMGADEDEAGSVETLVLGPKAVQTAESYVLALFHLYPNLYFHKATRGAEKVFQALMRRLVTLFQDSNVSKAGIPDRHPIIRFIEEPTNLQRALDLDDTVFWGALPMLADAEDDQVRKLAGALRERHLMKCIDLKQMVESVVPIVGEDDRKARNARVMFVCEKVAASLKDQTSECSEYPERFLVDQYSRNPYKRFQDSKSPLNQIQIRMDPHSPPKDIAEVSPVVASAEPFNLCRVYIHRDDTEAMDVIKNIIGTNALEASNGNT